MFCAPLQRAQLQLQCHRLWFSQFLAQTRCLSYATRKHGWSGDGQEHGLARGSCHFNWKKHQTARLKASSYATKRIKIQKVPNRSFESQDEFLRTLREATKNLHISYAMELYRGLRRKEALGKQDFRHLAQALHQYLRTVQYRFEHKERRDWVDDLISFANDLVADVKKAKLLPNGQAHVHLLGFFKESGARESGKRFWEWLERQDDRYVNADVYGAAIELLAVEGAPLKAMEDLYQQALERFPGNFTAYHLSPDAILPERDQPTWLKGINVTLLQGILTARLLRGDTRNAYLALDTALRLYPDQTPPRFFKMFLDERPVLEAYTVFAMACRAGTKLPINHLSTILAALRSISDFTSPTKHSLAIRAMLSSVYMYSGIGQSIKNKDLLHWTWPGVTVDYSSGIWQ